VSALARIPVGVVVERRKATSTWIDHVWRPLSVLPGEPATPPWSLLSEDGPAAVFFAGDASIELYRTDTSHYRDNLATGAPLVWVVLRPTGHEPPFEIATVTANPAEGEAYTGPGTDLVDSVPMPDAVREIVTAFVAEHHVEQPFFKRERKRADPQALARRGLVNEDDE
jgi:hypothetical protein